MMDKTNKPIMENECVRNNTRITGIRRRASYSKQSKFFIYCKIEKGRFANCANTNNRYIELLIDNK